MKTALSFHLLLIALANVEINYIQILVSISSAVALIRNLQRLKREEVDPIYNGSWKDFVFCWIGGIKANFKDFVKKRKK